MTTEEKEIRDWEKRLMARIRRVKIKESKKLAAMTTEEFVEYYRQKAEESKAMGLNVVYSLK